ncbi:alanine racemase [Anaerolineales bacterium HSG25]|nr:alanine racemase [Anaerolineales bacterium HSG25]
MSKLTIIKPTLLLDQAKTRRNIDRMVDKANRNGVRFRPHFKTHQSAEIGNWFRQAGVTAITVSSVDMASYFAQHGWSDILIAFPVNILEIDALNQLATQINLSLLVESAEVVQFLTDNLHGSADVWLKADVGYHRTGILTSQPDRFVRLVEQIEATSNLTFKGLLTHAGHSYQARGRAALHAVYQEMVAQFKQVQAVLPQAQISIGDTPTCSVVDDFSGLDEIRPGNFVFYDVMQRIIGSCTSEQIAVAVACPVVAIHVERGEAIIYGGAVHLSKESFEDAGHKTFGDVAYLQADGWSAPVEGAYVSALSQEHGIVKLPPKVLNSLRVGDILAVLPVHSCLTVNLLRTYHTLAGEQITRPVRE